MTERRGTRGSARGRMLLASSLGATVGTLLGLGACGSELPSDDGSGASGGNLATSGGSSSGAAENNGSGAASSGAAASGGGNSLGGAMSTGGSGTGGSGAGGSGTGGATGEDGWSLVWSDEFEGTAIDSAKWEHEVNCWGGGNNEDQCYVTDAKNSFTAGGALHIVALEDNPSGPEGGGSGNDGIVSKGHSSARLRTMNRGDFKYGRVEARMQLPSGQGLWPAFWMLPTDSVYGGWAASGEIDIMEAVNLDPSNEVHGTLHYGGVWPENTSTGASTTPSSSAWENFHVYAVEWEEGEVRWFVDDTHYQSQNDWFSSAAAYPAPFDERFHIVLNVAVGGNWPGPPDGSTTFPQELVVDYVRVFECAADPDTGHGCGTSD
jgi:beta-glucanase (GH16 family)